MKSYTSVGLLLSLAFLAVSLFLNYHYNRSLYLLGVDMIITMQKFQSPLVNAFFIFFTFLVDPNFVAITLVVSFAVFPRKFQALVATIAILFNTYVFFIMKVVLSEPRPFWTHQVVKNIGYYCPKDFGSPSGHTEFAAFFYAILLIHFNKARSIFWIVGGLATIFFVMVSRMYLGGHSLDQVVFGFLVAIALGIIYGFGGGMQLISRTLINFNSNAVKIKTFLFLAAFAGLNFIVYFNNKKKGTKFINNFKVWQKNFNNYCDFDIKVDKINESSLLQQTAILFLIAGFCFAFEYISVQDYSVRYLLGRWSFSIRKWKWLSYLIYVITNLAFLALPYALASPLYWLLDKTFAAKLVIALIPSLFSPACSVCLSFYLLKVIGLLSFGHEKSDDETKELLNKRVVC